MCNDPALTYLNDLGYNVIRYPRADIMPLEVLGRQHGAIQRLGRLSQLFSDSSVVAPMIRLGVRASNIEARRSRKLDTNAALSVLGPYLSALGAAPGASAHFRRCKALEFVFTDVLLDEVTAADVGALLGRYEIDARNLLWRSYLEGDGELFVIVETLKSCRLTLAVDAGTDAGLDLDTGAIRAVVGAKVGVSASDKAASLLSFDGTVPLVFGFKCLQLKVAGGKLALVSAAASSALAFSPGSGGGGDGGVGATEPVLLAAGMVRVPSAKKTPAVEDSEAPAAASAESDKSATTEEEYDTAPLPEEDSPSFLEPEEMAFLCVQLLDSAQRSCKQLECHVYGPLTAQYGRGEQREFVVDVYTCSDTDGLLQLEGCPTGAYGLTLAGTDYVVHTLRAADLRSDPEPYRVVTLLAG